MFFIKTSLIYQAVIDNVEVTLVKMVTTTLRRLVSPKKVLPLIIQRCSCRRAMVNNLLCRKVSRSWLQSKPDPPHPRLFTEPRCRDYVTIWFIMYRWIISLCWIGIIICSVWEIGSLTPVKHNPTWPIYLTNWDLVLGAAQSILGVFLVTRRWTWQKTVNGFNGCNIVYGKLDKIYWVLYIITSQLALGVSIVYWAGVYDPKIHQIDPLNIMLHIFNSSLMLLDICVTKVPFKFRHFWWCQILLLTYAIFSIIYFIAGGVDKYGYHYIYKILDWKKPFATTPIVIGLMMLIIMIHCTLCYIAALLNRRFQNSAKYVIESSSPSPSVRIQKSKGLEIV